MGPLFFSRFTCKKRSTKASQGHKTHIQTCLCWVKKFRSTSGEKPGSSAIPFRPQRIDCSALREGTAEGSTAPRLLSVGLGNQITRERTGLRVRFFVILNEVYEWHQFGDHHPPVSFCDHQIPPIQKMSWTSCCYTPARVGVRIGRVDRGRRSSSVFWPRGQMSLHFSPTECTEKLGKNEIYIYNYIYI